MKQWSLIAVTALVRKERKELIHLWKEFLPKILRKRIIK
jgi:hypothetical protein